MRSNSQLTLFKRHSPLSEVIVPAKHRAARKIDLHRHLLGSVSASKLLSVAKQHNISLPTDSLAELEALLTISQPVAGLRPYFRPWSVLSRCVTSPAVVSLFVYHALEAAHEDNVIYSELRVGWGMTGHEPFSVNAFLGAVQDGIRRAQEDFGVTGRALFGITRHLFALHEAGYRKRLWRNILDAVSQHTESVVGFDLSGIEAGYPPRLFVHEFQEVRSLGFPISVHCGETVSVQDVWETLELLGPRRISHALAAASDDRLMATIARAGVAVEICPTSNWLSGAVCDLTEHPMRKMNAAGLVLTLNTDNPAVCKTTLSRECALATSCMGFSDDDIGHFTSNALAAAFVDPETRTQLGQIISQQTRKEASCEAAGGASEDPRAREI